MLQLTPKYAAGVGRAIALVGTHTRIEVEAGADIWVRVTEDASEAAPSASPAPVANDDVATYVHLGTAGDKFVWDLSQGFSQNNAGRSFKQVLFWTIVAGVHQVSGPGPEA